MAGWQIGLAAIIGVMVAVLTGWITSVLGRPSPKASVAAALAAVLLSAVSLRLANPAAGDPCAIQTGVLSPSTAVVVRGDSRLFELLLEDGELLYDWSAREGEMIPGLNSNVSYSTYHAPPTAGDDRVTVSVYRPGCRDIQAYTYTASVGVAEPLPTPDPALSPTPTNPVTPASTPAPTAEATPAAPSPTPTLAPGAERRREQDGALMVWVPAGRFTMGSAADDSEAASDEQPAHDVQLDAFWLDKFEITNFQYAQCVLAGECSPSAYVNDSAYNGQTQPVVGVDWNDASAYCQWAGARLPTEAEWEYAARGPENRRYPWGDTFDGTRANFCDESCTYNWRDASVNDGYERTAPVGSFPTGASWVGAQDMAGNVWEWVNDWYASDYYAQFVSDNPQGPDEVDSNGNKIFRGGSWFNFASYLRAASRPPDAPDLSYASLGVRCLLPAQAPDS